MRAASHSNRTLWIGALLLAAMALGSVRYWASLPSQPGYDLYQFRGVAMAQRQSGYRLGSPYLHPDRYKVEMQREAAASGDDILVQAVAMRSDLDLTATPFLYYAFGLIRGSYADLLGAVRALQLLGCMLASALLIRSIAPASNGWACGVFSITLALAYDPLLLDLSVANLSALQLFNLCLIATILARKAARGEKAGASLAAVLACWLVLLTFLKPNVIGATLLLGISLLAVSTREGWTGAVVATVLSCLLFLALPCVLFGTASVWADWLRGPLVEFSGRSILSAPGNYSVPAFLLRHGGWSATLAGAAAACILVASWLVPAAAGPLSRSRIGERAGVLLQPFFGIGFGATAVLALSPIVWSHYLVLLLPAALFCCFTTNATGTVRLLGWLSLLLLADLPRRLFQLCGFPSRFWLELFHAFCWLPGWIGLAVCALAPGSRPSGDVAGVAQSPA